VERVAAINAVAERRARLQRHDREESAGHPHRPRPNSPTRRDTIWRAKPPRRPRDHTSADRLIDGHWDRPFDEAVELMNEWLTRHKTTRDLQASDGERVLE